MALCPSSRGGLPFRGVVTDFIYLSKEVYLIPGQSDGNFCETNPFQDEKINFDEVGPRLRELNASREQLLSEQKTLEQGMDQEAIPCPPRAEVKRYVEDLRETLEKGSLMEQKGFLRSWIKRIDIHHPNAEIEYAIPLAPPRGGNPARREVLSIVQSGCPYWTRSATPQRPSEPRFYHSKPCWKGPIPNWRLNRFRRGELTIGEGSASRRHESRRDGRQSDLLTTRKQCGLPE